MDDNDSDVVPTSDPEEQEAAQATTLEYWERVSKTIHRGIMEYNNAMKSLNALSGQEKEGRRPPRKRVKVSWTRFCVMG